MKTSLDQRLYREYMEFFEKAERERRWNVFTDIPWDKVRTDIPDELALNAETFASVEMYLPDYVAGGIQIVRDYFGQAWFQANWGYEESKHSLGLGEYLVRSGKRTREDWFELQKQILSKHWAPLFKTGRQMTCYGMVQEMATFVIYVKHREMAKKAGDEALRTLYDYIARDEIAHTRFYQGVVKVLMEEDREGTLADLAHVFANFKMPGVGLVPDYEDRILKMRDAGIDRSVFIKKIYLPVLKYIGVSRHEMLAAQRKALEARNAGQADPVEVIRAPVAAAPAE